MTGNSIILATSGEAVERGGAAGRGDSPRSERRRRKERGTRGRKNERKRKPRLRVLRSYDLHLKDTSLGRSGTRCLRFPQSRTCKTLNVKRHRKQRIWNIRVRIVGYYIYHALFELRDVTHRIMISTVSHIRNSKKLFKESGKKSMK